MLVHVFFARFDCGEHLVGRYGDGVSLGEGPLSVGVTVVLVLLRERTVVAGWQVHDCVLTRLFLLFG